jgi:glycosyltransferase involved in cell wall biosynthesis
MTTGVIQLGPYPPPQGGIQTHLVALRQFLLDRQIPCAAINLTRFRRPDGDGVYYPESALGVARLLLRLPYPIVHLHIGGNLTNRLLALSLFCSLLPDRRTVLTFHSGGYPTSPAGRTAGPHTARGIVLRRFDRVIAVNAAIAGLLDRLGLRPDRVRVISPFSVAEPAPSTALTDRLRDFCGVHRPLLLTVGLLEPEYDLPLQIETLGRVRERFPKAGLVILGSGSLEQELRAAISTKPYASDILLHGDAPHPLTLRLISDSDLLLRTTWYDGDSISVREALHLGTPVIATDNGMRPDGVELVPPRDPAALLQAITRRLTDEAPPAARLARPDGNLQAVLDVYAELSTELGVGRVEARP